MEKRRFGHSNLHVSAISLDCSAALGGSTRLLERAYDAGISFFDTRGQDRCESLVADFLKSVPRERVQIASSFPRLKQHLSPKFVRPSLEQSLKHLGIETIDVYLAREINRHQFRHDLFAELTRAQAEGKIRVWGISLGPDIGWREEGFEAMLKHRAQAVQTPFSILEQNPGKELCELAASQHAGVLARADIDPAIVGTAKLDLLRRNAQERGLTLRQLCYKWLLQQPGLTSITARLEEGDIAEAVDSIHKPDLTTEDLTQIATDYARDWNLGEGSHPRRLKSSVDPSGSVRASYVAPPVLFA